MYKEEIYYFPVCPECNELSRIDLNTYSFDMDLKCFNEHKNVIDICDIKYIPIKKDDISLKKYTPSKIKKILKNRYQIFFFEKFRKILYYYFPNNETEEVKEEDINDEIEETEEENEENEKYEKRNEILEKKNLVIKIPNQNIYIDFLSYENESIKIDSILFGNNLNIEQQQIIKEYLKKIYLLNYLYYQVITRNYTILNIELINIQYFINFSKLPLILTKKNLYPIFPVDSILLEKKYCEYRKRRKKDSICSPDYYITCCKYLPINNLIIITYDFYLRCEIECCGGSYENRDDYGNLYVYQFENYYENSNITQDKRQVYD